VTITEVVNQNYNEFELDTSRKNASGGIGTLIGQDSGSQDSYVEYTVSFHAAADPSSPITLNNISVTMKDVDELEYIMSENVDSYTLSSSPATNLDVRTVGSDLFVEELENRVTGDDDESHWAALHFESTSTITIGLGLKVGNEDGESRFDAMFTSSASDDSTTPNLANTGANVEWPLFAGLIAVIAGSSFMMASRRRRTS
jgi:LPXTG-motif cell wall-anchored protein